MSDIQIKLSALWLALMLTYLLGDVLRIYSGDFKPGQIGGVAMTQAMWLGVAVVMVVPIVMVVLSLVLDPAVNRPVNVIAAIGLFAFNLIGLPTYPGAYDKFLIVVGLVFNALTVRYALLWA
ncbi:MAG TPA: DUF6326 family protein [Candidatus Limnocylindrales bacterium]